MEGKSRMPEVCIDGASNVFADGGLTWLPPSDSFPDNPQPGWAFMHATLHVMFVHDGRRWLRVSDGLSELDAFRVMNGLAMLVNGKVIEVRNGRSKR